MASSASDLLKLELQATGENPTTWGTKLNTLVSRMEQSVAGTTDVALTASDYTLDDTNYSKGSGTTAEAHRMFLSCTGTLTANVNIIVPDRTKPYIVFNNTSGAYTVTVKTSAGTGITVAQGGKAIVWCDGTNVIDIGGLVNDLSPQLGAMLDVNGQSLGDGTLELLKFTETASAVNELTIKNNVTTSAPELQATGDDTDIDLALVPKGAGAVSVGQVTDYENNVTADDDLPNKKYCDDTYSPITRGVNAQTGTTYTLVLTDAGKVVTMDNASANTLTIPLNASVAFPTNTQIDILMKGAGSTTVTGDTGVTVNGVSAGGATIDGQYKAITLLKVATDTWIMFGAHGTVA